MVCLLRRWRLGGAWHDGDLHGTTEGVTKPGFRGGRGAGTAQEQADTAACCGGGGLASDGVLVPGTRTGVDACAAKQGSVPRSKDFGLAGGDLPAMLDRVRLA